MNNARSLPTLITAATAVVALAAGMLMALGAPAPAGEDIGQAVAAPAPSEGA